MRDRWRIGAWACGALVVLALVASVATDVAVAEDTSATAAPTLAKVRARPQATTGGRTSWTITATAVDPDRDLIGGKAKVKIGPKGKVLSRRIVRAKSRSTTGLAAMAAQGIRSATLAGRALRVVFFADLAPGPVTVTFWVTDKRGKSSKRVVLKLRVKATETVSIAATDPAAAEPSNTGTFTVTRTGGGTATPLTVSYTVAGSATPGGDYTALPGSVTIPTGRASVTMVVTPVDDDAIESTESVAVTLAASTAYIVGSSSSATVDISSDDTLPTVSVTATDPAAAEPSATGTFTVARTGRTTASLSVTYTVAGTATAGTDYTTLTGTLTIAAGTTSGRITVTPIDNTALELPETVIVTLQASTRYTIGTPSTATVTITDDDVVPTVTVTATDAAAAEPSSTGTFTLARTGSTTTALTVNFALGGTATSGSDYSAPPASPLTIPAGATSATITVTPIDDSVVESAETVVATLMAGTGYEIGTPSTATVTISDDEPVEPEVTIAATDATAAEPANSGVFTVTRTGSTTAPLDVFYTVTGAATNGTDYTVLAGSVTIPAGQSSATITVGPIDDTDVESDETVILTLDDVAGYSVGTPSAATVTIADND
jgi:Calx-beta domain